MITAGSRHVSATRVGSLGHIVLDRPEAINALTFEMVDALSRQLRAWRSDPAIAAVLLTGAGDRGFCAGGDLLFVLNAIRSGRPGLARAFWQAEYALDATIARFPKPIVTVLDGIVMGGGVGLACHAHRRLATERAEIAMPEVGIGLHPDVGAAFLLARAPGEVGAHLALTASRIGPEDAIHCGLVDQTIASHAVGELPELLGGGKLDDVLGRLPEAPPTGLAGPVERGREWIDASYGGDSVERILSRLRGRSEAEAYAASTEIESRSPTSLKVTLRALRMARSLPSLETCLEQDLRLSCGLLETHDFSEGIRAVVVDKDRDPHWDPASLAEVSAEMVDRFFRSDRDKALAF